MLTNRIKQLGMISSISIAISFVLIFMGKFELILALWILFFTFLPSLLLVRSLPFLSIKVVVYFVVVTQAVTLPLFYLRAESYRFQSHRPYEFTGLESIKVFIPLGLLLFTIVLVSFILLQISSKKFTAYFRNKDCNTAAIRRLQYVDLPNYRLLKNCRYNTNVFIAIFIVITIMIPVNAWMFQKGIGLTGVAPPHLPFRLSGVLTYLAKLIVPSLLFFLYFLSTRKSYLIVFLFGLYSIFLGVATVSRGSVLLVMLAPLACAIFDRRIAIMMLSSFLVSLSFLVATVARNFVYVVDEGVSGVSMDLDVFRVLVASMNEVDLELILFSFLSIVERLTSFQNLFMSSQFDAVSVGGGWAIFAKQIDWRLIAFNHKEMHLEMLGYVVPNGFYMGLKGFWGPAMAAMSQSYFFLLPFGIFATFFLILQEWLLRKITTKYCLKKDLLLITIVIFTLNFLVGQGQPLINYLMALLVLVALMPRVKEASVFLGSLGIKSR